MICRNCGSEIPEGQLYCKFCGEEVQLVPEYSSVDMQRVQKRMEEEELERERREREAEAAERRKRNRIKPWRVVLDLILIAGIAGVMSFFAWKQIDKTNEANPGYLLVQSEKARSAGNIEEAIAFLDKAFSVSSTRSVDIPMKKAELLAESGRLPEAVTLLEELYEEHSDSRTVLSALLHNLEEANLNSRISEIVSGNCPEDLRSAYSAYLANPPRMSLMNGNTYIVGTMLSMSADGIGKIYYTTDSTEPDETSILYTDPVMLEAGTWYYKAVFINDKGIRSDTTTSVYNVKRAADAAAP